MGLAGASFTQILIKMGVGGKGSRRKKESGVLTLPLSSQGGTFRDPEAGVLSRQRGAMLLTALNVSVFSFPSLDQGPEQVIQLSLPS